MADWNQVREALSGGAPILAPGIDGAQVPAGIAAVVSTSGSTGAAKGVLLSRSALLSAGEAVAERFGGMSWVSALPSDYVAGLMTMVRSYVAGFDPMFAATDLSDLRPASRRAAISLVSTQLFRALRDPKLVAALGSYELILVGGSAVSSKLVAEARELGLNVVVSYGMTETCGGCVYDGIPLPGTELKVVAEDALPAGEGRVWVSGPQLFSGYVGEPAATREALVDGWLRTRDRARLGGTPLAITGRDDSVVISGGMNVDLAAAQRVLDQEPIGAMITSLPDAQWGDLIVLVAEPGRDVEAWRAALRDRLQPAALPKRVFIVDKLPATERGKVDRELLKRIVEGGVDGDNGAVGPGR